MAATVDIQYAALAPRWLSAIWSGLARCQQDTRTGYWRYISPPPRPYWRFGVIAMPANIDTTARPPLQWLGDKGIRSPVDNVMADVDNFWGLWKTAPMPVNIVARAGPERRRAGSRPGGLAQV